MRPDIEKFFARYGAALSFDETGAPAPVSVETYRYLVRAVQPDEPLIVAAVVTG